MESANKIYPISESHRERMTPAIVKLEGARYAVPVLVDASRGDPRDVAESILGPLASFKALPVDATAHVAVTANPAPVTYLAPPIEEAALAPRPIAPAPPRLAVDNSKPGHEPPPKVDGNAAS